MAAKRISKSTIDWAKFAEYSPAFEKARFAAFKARSDLYLRRVQTYPENPPAVNWSEYRTKVADKSIVDQLEKAYQALKIPYPEDTVTALVDAQEKNCEQENTEFVKWSEGKLKEAEALKYKFEIMIPYDMMTDEEFTLTFPCWSATNDDPTITPHIEKTPGLSKEERREIAQSEEAQI